VEAAATAETSTAVEAAIAHATVGKAAVAHAPGPRIPAEVHAAGVGHAIGVALSGRTETAWLPGSIPGSIHAGASVGARAAPSVAGSKAAGRSLVGSSSAADAAGPRAGRSAPLRQPLLSLSDSWPGARVSHSTVVTVRKVAVVIRHTTAVSRIVNPPVAIPDIHSIEVIAVDEIVVDHDVVAAVSPTNAPAVAAPTAATAPDCTYRHPDSK
jgi:hypothetical protein